MSTKILDPKSVFTIREVKLLGELQCSKDELRARRQHFLTEGLHWALVKNRVCLSSDGAALLRSTFATALPSEKDPARPASSSAQPKGLLGPVPFKGEVVVWRTPPKNGRLVVAYLPGTEPMNPLNLISVAVADNQNFLQGMLIPVRHVRDKLYELQGRPPRMRGRWGDSRDVKGRARMVGTDKANVEHSTSNVQRPTEGAAA